MRDKEPRQRAGIDRPTARKSADDSATIVQPVRGPAWVLAWAAAGSLLLFVAILLSQFGLLLVNHRKLVRAAQRAATEATLPRATHASISAAARRALRDSPRLAAAMHTSTRINGRLQAAATEIRLEPADTVKVHVAVMAVSAVPNWLRCVGLSMEGQLLEGTAQRQRQAR